MVEEQLHEVDIAHLGGDVQERHLVRDVDVAACLHQMLDDVCVPVDQGKHDEGNALRLIVEARIRGLDEAQKPRLCQLLHFVEIAALDGVKDGFLLTHVFLQPRSWAHRLRRAS